MSRTGPDPRPLVLALLAACGQGVDRVEATSCDPVADTGCPADEHCRLAEGGRRACLPPESNIAGSVPCTPGSCAPGEACARVEGYLACRPVCRLAAPVCATDATCSYALDDTHGLCVSACRPLPPHPEDDCPLGACAPVAGLEHPICVATGPSADGEPCDANRCGPWLACLEDDDGVRCRSLCEPGRDDQCPDPSVCSGEVAGLPLGYCRGS